VRARHVVLRASDPRLPGRDDPRYRVAIGPSASDFQVVELKSQLAADSYRVTTRYDTDRRTAVLGDRRRLERNPFLGLQPHLRGRRRREPVVEKERTQFRTDLAITRTRQQDVVDDPGWRYISGGAVSTKWVHTFRSGVTCSARAGRRSELERARDLRGDMTPGVSRRARTSPADQPELLYDRTLRCRRSSG